MDSNEPAVVVKDLYKSFKLPHEQHNGLKQLLLNIARQNKGYEVQHVLDDISFEIKKGEFFGIVGRNGSGKSTLLKLLAGIYVPDKGLVQVNGSLTPFIELGVGFNPELTGRENVFMNGALLGFGRQEMEAMYKDIVEFAELTRFMDQKLKNYSSGMQVRLAFSIAIRAKTDILLIDEVLAVGDENFQRKCMQHFVKLKRDKQTVVFITHDMSQVRRFCDRALYLEDGKIVSIGDTKDISNMYVRNNLEFDSQPDQPTEIGTSQNTTVKFRNGDRVVCGQTVHIDMSWDANDAIKNVGIAITKDTGEYVFGTNTIIDDAKINGEKITYEFVANLIPGKYSISTGIFGELDTDVIHFNPAAIEFIVEPAANQGDWGGITQLEHSWRTNV